MKLVHIVESKIFEYLFLAFWSFAFTGIYVFTLRPLFAAIIMIALCFPSGVFWTYKAVVEVKARQK